MRWLRLANLIAACPDEMYLEDSRELALWRTRPPAIQVDGQVVWLPQVPPYEEWSRPEDEIKGD